MKSSNREKFAIGIDLGTGSCKTIVLGESGKVHGFASATYETRKNFSKWVEQDPEALFDGLVNSLTNAVQAAHVHASDCLGISIGGALHSLMAVKRDHQPLTGVITWADMRSKRQSESIACKYQERQYYQRSGCPNNPMYPLSKIIWLREEQSDLFSKVEKFISAKEYVLWKLTGVELTDYAIASGSGLFNINNFNWDDELLKLAGINKEYLSKLADPLVEAGYLDADIAKKVGLSSRIQIYLGSADAVNSSIGAGTVDSSSLTCMIGTSGAIRTICPQPVLDQEKRLWCYAINNNHWLVGGAINNGGLVLDWLKNLFNHVVPAESEISFKQLVDWAAEIQPGAQGLLCLPFLTQERSPYWNPNMRAVLFGLTLEHDHRHIARAFLEGIGFRMKSVLDVLGEVLEKDFKELIASGGFIASPSWVQIFADIFNHKISIPTYDETSAIGAAYWVLQANHVIDSLADMKKVVGISRVYSPEREPQPVYAKAYATYKELYFSSRRIFEENN